MNMSRLLGAILAYSMTVSALAQEPQPLLTIKTPGRSLAVTDDGKLAIGSDRILRVVDFEGIDKIETLEKADAGQYVSVAFSGNGMLLAAVKDEDAPPAAFTPLAAPQPIGGFAHWAAERVVSGSLAAKLEETLEDLHCDRFDAACGCRRRGRRLCDRLHEIADR